MQENLSILKSLIMSALFILAYDATYSLARKIKMAFFEGAICYNSLALNLLLFFLFITSFFCFSFFSAFFSLNIIFEFILSPFLYTRNKVVITSVITVHGVAKVGYDSALSH